MKIVDHGVVRVKAYKVVFRIEILSNQLLYIVIEINCISMYVPVKLYTKFLDYI